MQRRGALRRIGLGLGAGASVGLAGCTRRPDPRGPLEFWAMGREAEVVAELLPPFRQRYPGIEVRIQQMPWTAAHEKLLTAYAGDALPDLCQLGNTWIPEFTALDALEALDERIASSSVKRDDYFSGILERFCRPRRLIFLFCGDLLSGVGCRVQYCVDWNIQKSVAQTLHYRGRACRWDF